MSGWSNETPANPPPPAEPPASRVVRAKLDTIGDVKTQLARLYREARGGKIATQDATRLASMLAMLGRMIEGSDLEDRLAALEGANQ